MPTAIKPAKRYPMEVIVALAIDRTKDYKYLWYEDKLICAIISEAVNLGWVLRTSITQVEWTEKGAEAYRKANND